MFFVSERTHKYSYKLVHVCAARFLWERITQLTVSYIRLTLAHLCMTESWGGGPVLSLWKDLEEEVLTIHVSARTLHTSVLSLLSLRLRRAGTSILTQSRLGAFPQAHSSICHTSLDSTGRNWKPGHTRPMSSNRMVTWEKLKCGRWLEGLSWRGNVISCLILQWLNTVSINLQTSNIHVINYDEKATRSAWGVILTARFKLYNLSW